MSDEKKTPQPGEWWFSSRGSRVLVLPSTHTGRSTVEAEEGWIHHNWNFDGWHHEQRCTGWDWQPPSPIDPGEGWELLPKRAVLQEGDEARHGDGTWWNTICAGDRGSDLVTYRRRKPPAEVWPKWYRWSDESLTFAFSRMADGTVFTHQSGVPTLQSDDWHVSLQGALKAGNLIEVTEAEAIARVKPAVTREEIAERTIERVKRFDPSAVNPAEPIAAERVPDNRPAREVIEDMLTWLNEDPDDGDMSSANAALAGRRWLEDNPEDTTADVVPLVTAAVESPDDWVEITDQEHVLRKNVDQMSSNGGVWVDVFESHGTLLSRRGGKARCRRRDLPAPPVLQPKRTPVDLIAIRDNRVIWRPHGQTLMKNEQFIQNDADGFFVEEYRGENHR